MPLDKLVEQTRQIAQLLNKYRLGEAIEIARERAPDNTMAQSHETGERFIIDRLMHLFSDRTPPNTPAPSFKPPKPGFFKADTWRNPEYSELGIKTAAAATLAYMIYTIIGWDGIHTAMITCYVAALGSTGETVHKLALRIGGCILGAAIGIGSIIWLIPHMTDIGQLMLLVFAGSLLAAYVSSGSERIAYGGIQIGLAFLMTVLQGFSPTPEVSVATDRFYGILLGNIIMFIIFTRLWPVSVATTVRRQLSTIANQLQLFATHASDPANRPVLSTGLDKMMGDVSQTVEMLDYNRYEPANLRLTPQQNQQWETALDQTENLILQVARQAQLSTCTDISVQSVHARLADILAPTGLVLEDTAPHPESDATSLSRSAHG